jgi:GT2 family glycosyltransferase
MQDIRQSATFIQTGSKLRAVLAQDGWSLLQVANLLSQYGQDSQNDGKQADVRRICLSLLLWLNALTHVGTHAAHRRYTRLQLIENALSLAGWHCTRRDFEPWFLADASLAPQGDWQADALLPYAPEDTGLRECQERIDDLEHALHQAQVALNRSQAELHFVEAERKHFMAVAIENVHALVRQDFEKSTSWRVTKPLRATMAWIQRLREPLRGRLQSNEEGQQDSHHLTNKSIAVINSEPLTWESVIPPWEKPGYNTEVAWRGKHDDDFDRHDYAEWCKRYEKLADIDTLLAEAKRLEALKNAPLFSILMMVEQDALAYFKEAVSSVQNQMYGKWELCIAISTRADVSLIDFLAVAQQDDSRIKYTRVDGANDYLLNEAALLAKGDWLGILNAINTIAANATFIMAKTIFESGKYEIIYADSDELIWPDCVRDKPDFKPDWNVDLFLSQDYTRDCCFFARALLNECGVFDTDAKGLYADSFDITLRAMERIEPELIFHIPRVLVHVRMLSGSADNSAAIDSSDSSHSNHRIESLKQYFARTGQNAQVTAGDGSWEIRYGLPAAHPLVSLIIPTKDNLALLHRCISSITTNTNYDNFEILVIDNGSVHNATLDYLRELSDLPQLRVIRDNGAFNYSALNNAAVALAKGEIIALLNDDIDVKSPNWLSEMVSHALRPGVGAVGARLWYPDMRLQHAGIVLVGGVARHVHKFLSATESGFNGRAQLTQNFSAVTGACLVVKKALYEAVGGLNEKELAVGFNDVDFCLRLIEAGYRNVWTPYAELIHHESATRGQDDAPDKQRRAEKERRYMRQRWGSKMEADPAYNPNLTDGHDDFSLAWPPR